MKIKIEKVEIIQVCDLELDQLAIMNDPQSDWDGDIIIITQEYNNRGNSFAVNLTDNYVCPTIDIEHFNCVAIEKGKKLIIEVE